MSRSVDLFIQSALPAPELAAEIGGLVEAALTPSAEGASWSLQAGEVAATLREHAFADDGELVFSNYKYALSAHVSNSARVLDSPEVAFLRRVSDLIHKGPGYQVLLVIDLQYRDKPAPPSPADVEPVGGQ